MTTFLLIIIYIAFIGLGIPDSLLALVRIIYKYHHSLLKFKRNIYKKTEAIFCFRQSVDKPQI